MKHNTTYQSKLYSILPWVFDSLDEACIGKEYQKRSSIVNKHLLYALAAKNEREEVLYWSKAIMFAYFGIDKTNEICEYCTLEGYNSTPYFEVYRNQFSRRKPK